MAEHPSFKDTLNLPHTDFPIRPNAAAEQQALLDCWAKEDLYVQATNCNEGAEKFILHDGPPYANGHIHIGHAYNKVLKDIIAKSQRMAGKHVPVIPGWDCHGLPIELRVTKENPGITGTDLIAACRAYASHWIDVQRKEFINLGVIMNWQEPYITMSYAYEASIVRAFSEFVSQGYIQKKLKTVPWCASCATVLAQAEIEYQERKDPSIYVTLPLSTTSAAKALPALQGKPVSVVIWTTTPWTLPLNRAVLVHPDAEYSVFELSDKYIILGAKSAAGVLAKMPDVQATEVCRLRSADLLGLSVHHPIEQGRVVPIIAADFVSLDDGTAFVHCAPGCGPDDYEIGVTQGLEIYCPVSPHGLYQEGIAPKDLVGMSVADGQSWVLTYLQQQGNLLHKTSLRHAYPHCWRCRNGLIYRATSQWFCDLSQHNLKERAMEAIEAIRLVPSSNNSLGTAVSGRLEWCLSRQRTWGVPIPAVVCTSCGHAELIQQVLDAVTAGVATEGVEFWRRVELADILPHNTKCTRCGGASFTKEYDILDVWFDSGVSHYAVLHSDAQRYPADVYLEGRDQARGWFQSSLLTSLVLEKSPFTKTIVTHGYTVDDQGRKMSKSLGNGIEPQEMMDRVGIDGLRLWVSSIDAGSDAVISNTLLSNVSETYRKIRNTCRFLLSNLYDFDPARDAIAADKLPLLDQYALTRLAEFEQNIRTSYEQYDPTAVYHTFVDYCTTELSSLYLDVIKDRLYVEKADGYRRRSAQTVCYQILHVLTTLMAPIMSFTAEQISDYYQGDKKNISIHLQPFASVQNLLPLLHAVDRHEWQMLFKLRDLMLKAIEGQRAAGIVKHPLEAQLTVGIDANSETTAPLRKLLERVKNSGQDPEQFLAELVVVSFCRITDLDASSQFALPGVSVVAARVAGSKCPRCWQYTQYPSAHGLCPRCSEVLAGY